MTFQGKLAKPISNGLCVGSFLPVTWNYPFQQLTAGSGK
jgi:hypothetical protein